MIQSTATKYAIRAVCHLAHLEPGARAQAREISEELSIPQAFLSKILQDLTKKGLLNSAKGPNGGFELNCSPTETSLYALVRAVEGPRPEGDCLLGLSLCADETKCPIHDTWKEICESFRESMKGISLMDVVEADQEKRQALESTLAVGSTTPLTAIGADRNLDTPVG
jgi:Rrf2 family iron-sulfur cluster assembly transcriptional regulator